MLLLNETDPLHHKHEIELDLIHYYLFATNHHFHMLCRRCGNLMHVDCALMRTMSEHLMKDHGFMLDPRETILVGVCEKCRGVGGEEADHVADGHEGCHHCL